MLLFCFIMAVFDNNKTKTKIVLFDNDAYKGAFL